MNMSAYNKDRLELESMTQEQLVNAGLVDKIDTAVFVDEDTPQDHVWLHDGSVIVFDYFQGHAMKTGIWKSEL